MCPWSLSRSEQPSLHLICRRVDIIFLKLTLACNDVSTCWRPNGVGGFILDPFSMLPVMVLSVVGSRLVL